MRATGTRTWRRRSRECLADVLEHWRSRTSEEPVGHGRLHGRLKGLHRQRRDGLLRCRHKGLHRRRRGSVLVVAARYAIPSCTVAATTVASITVATSVETTTVACTVEAAAKTASSTTAASDESTAPIIIAKESKEHREKIPRHCCFFLTFCLLIFPVDIVLLRRVRRRVLALLESDVRDNVLRVESRDKRETTNDSTVSFIDDE